MILGTLLVALAGEVPATPPEDYGFRQGVDYRIEAILDEFSNTLRARARLRYTNNSPNTIDTLWIHQHLNAFRPNSAWAERELRFGEWRFQKQGPDDHAYERFKRVTVDEEEVRPAYRGSPDSTVAALPLPEPLEPGATIIVMMDWVARPSTIPRRQGRRGRHYDFAQWYPRIAVYDEDGWHPHPLLPQGEFFGEFASYDVTLDVAADQIIGATGVPVEGDPGWETAEGPGSREVNYQREAYPWSAAEPLGLLEKRPERGRKRIRWRAEDVHHFAWSADPEFKYEGSEHEGTAVHVLYQSGAPDWDSGVVLVRAIRSLTWLEETFGEYPYPQLTLLHRLEDGGTEFPMLVMNGGASQGLIAHEVTHQYAHAILANNEWRDAWLDEGFTSFLTTWFFEDHGVQERWWGTMEFAASWSPALEARPVATPAADFPNMQVYSLMSYTKGSIIFRMLREYIGRQRFREALRVYYERNRLSHVSEEDLREAVELASGQDLSWFFEQWLHTSARLDYSLGEVVTKMDSDGWWRTKVEVFRDGQAWMPVTLRVGTVQRQLDSEQRYQVVEITTAEEPTTVELDPQRVLLDSNLSNNRSKL